MNPKAIAGLSLALIVLLGVFWLRSRPVNEVGMEVEAITAFKSAKEVDRLAVKTNSAAYELSLRGGKWMIQLEKEWVEADPSLVEPMFSRIKDISASTIAAEGTDMGTYGLSDSQRVEVRAYKGGEEMGSVWIGFPGPAYRGTYIKFPKRPEIYLTDINLRTDLDQQPEALRENRLFGPMVMEDVQSVALETLSGSIELSKEGDKWAFQTGTKSPAKKEAVEEFLKTVLALKSAETPKAEEYQAMISGSAEVKLTLSAKIGNPVEIQVFPGEEAAGKVGIKSTFLARPATLFAYQVGALRKEAADFKDDKGTY